jgi:hypothetical protein
VRSTLIILIFISSKLCAQVNGTWLSSGSLNLRVNADGQMATFNGAAASEYVSGSNNHLFKFINVWISGVDAGQNLFISSNNGFNNKTDFSPGPVDTLTYAGADPANWNSIYSVTNSQIFNHRKNFRNLNYQPIAEIKNWPASVSGRYYQYLAPFIDYDQDGKYDPLKGDYPDIVGDKACYFIVNDNYSEHKASGGQPLKIETYGMLYTFNELPDVVFARIYVVNRTNKHFNNVKMSIHSGIELGNANDNFIGSIPSKNVAFAYNADNNDEGHFDANQPLAGIVSLNKTSSSILYITNDTNAITGMPITPESHRNFMNGLWKNGDILNFGNNGIGNGKPCKYVYPGSYDPLNSSENWIETGTGGERSILMNFDQNTLPSNGYISIDFAVFGKGKSNGNPYDAVNMLSNEISTFYRGQNLGIKPITNTNAIQLKNPILVGENILTNTLQNFDKIEVYNSVGQRIKSIKMSVENTLTIDEPGIYYISLIVENQIITKKLIII